MEDRIFFLVGSDEEPGTTIVFVGHGKAMADRLWVNSIHCLGDSPRKSESRKLLFYALSEPEVQLDGCAKSPLADATRSFLFPWVFPIGSADEHLLRKSNLLPKICGSL